MLFGGSKADLQQIIAAILLGSKWSVLLLGIVMQDAVSEVLKSESAVEVERTC